MKQRFAGHGACRERTHLNIVYPLRICVGSPPGNTKFGKLASAGLRACTNRKRFVRLARVGDSRALWRMSFSALVRCLLLWLQPRLRSLGRGFLVVRDSALSAPS